MNRILPSLALLLLLAASLGAKTLGFATPARETLDAGADDVADLLAKRGFHVTWADPSTAPAWITGERLDCHVQIADVSPQGWYRTIVAQQAEGRILRYVYAGRIYSDQPVLRTRIDDYGARLVRYFGWPVSAKPIRAILLSKDCPSGILSFSELASLD